MDKYNIIRKIGQGSFGTVLLVRSKRDRKKYVLKQINLQNVSNKDLKATYLEVQLLASINHPNIVAYKDAFQSGEGFLYIIMLYCDGGDLYTKIKNQKGHYFQEARIIEWIIQICLALQYLHDKNILHRDLKTQNIFLTKCDVVKVGDFGIAKVLDNENSMATTLIGTPYYMSPELFSNKPYNHKSDIWSLGCCIYEITTLRHAFDARDINSLIYKVLRGKLPTMPVHYSFELQELICNLLHLDPDKRPSAARVLHYPFIKSRIQAILKCRQTKHSTSDGYTGQKFSPEDSNLILEGQGLVNQTIHPKICIQKSKNDDLSTSSKDLRQITIPALVINGQEIKLEYRTEQESPKFQLKPEKSSRRKRENNKKVKVNCVPQENKNCSIFRKETKDEHLPLKLPSSVQHKLVSNVSMKSLRNSHRFKLQEGHRKEENEEITSIIAMLEKSIHIEDFPAESPRVASSAEENGQNSKLLTRIACLRHDCANGLGREVLSQALQLVNKFSSKELEVGLKDLLGSDKYIKYVGKIWQLKFCEDFVYKH